MIKLRKKEEKTEGRKGERIEGRKEGKEGMEGRMKEGGRKGEWKEGRKEGKRETREDGRGSGLCWYPIILCEGARQVLCQWLPWC